MTQGNRRLDIEEVNGVTIARFTGKPVYMVTRMPFAEIPGWVLGCTTRMFRTFDEVQQVLKAEHRPVVPR